MKAASRASALILGVAWHLGCSGGTPPAPAPPAATVAVSALPPPAAPAEKAPPKQPPLGPLAEPLDGIWEFAESCHGATTTYTLTIEGPRGELVTANPEGSRSQPIELVDAHRDDGAPVGAVATPVGDRTKPLFRLVRGEHVLSRWALGPSGFAMALGSSTTEGSFSPRCTTFASFIERDELPRQGWTHTTLGNFSLVYPAKIFRPPVRRPRSIDFAAPNVSGTEMSGQRAHFAIHLSIEKESPSDVLSKVIPGRPDEIDPTGPMIAGHRGLDLQLGIEGVGQHYVAVALDKAATLAVRIGWVSSFASPNLTLSDDMQLAIADRMLASFEDAPPAAKK